MLFATSQINSLSIYYLSVDDGLLFLLFIYRLMPMVFSFYFLAIGWCLWSSLFTFYIWFSEIAM